jgi:hypothetical protein
MEDFDRRRRQDEERQARREDHGRDRDSWWRGERDDDHPRRAERGWLDYDRDYGRSDERQGRREGQREDQRYRQGGEERSRFSPDWSREGARPLQSDEPYYSRNRERESEEQSRGARFGGRQGDDQSQWEQRSRDSIPRQQRELSERGRGDYYDPDWPYERSGRDRDAQRSRGGEEGSHYRGWYSRSATPFSYSGGTGYLYSESMTLHGPYTGRGPKGYKRSDQQIIEDACQRLERDGEIDASDIEVSAEDGVIRLRGTVPDRQTKRRAEECVESIYGARDVMNELRVEQQGSQRGQGAQGARAWEGTQASQSGRGSQPSQGAQGSQASQGALGSQASPGAGAQTVTPGMRPGAGSSTSEQTGDDKRTPRH